MTSDTANAMHHRLATTCPTCGRTSRPIRPTEQVVSGLAGPDVAPLLCAVWKMVRSMTRQTSGAVRQQDLVSYITAMTGAAEYTVLGIISAAVRAGHLHREYRTGGQPVRRRSYLTWAKTS